MVSAKKLLPLRQRRLAFRCECATTVRLAASDNEISAKLAGDEFKGKPVKTVASNADFLEAPLGSQSG